jgi:hypothetical protein
MIIIQLESSFEYESNDIIVWHISHIFLTKFMVKVFLEARHILINRHRESTILSCMPTSVFIQKPETGTKAGQYFGKE